MRKRRTTMTQKPQCRSRKAVETVSDSGFRFFTAINRGVNEKAAREQACALEVVKLLRSIAVLMKRARASRAFECGMWNSELINSAFRTPHSPHRPPPTAHCPLLIPERYHRIDFRGPSRWDEAGRESHHCQQRSDQSECQRISRAHLE